MNKLKKSTQKGFSLIELMIVIAIIAILATIAIPMYNRYTVRAKVGGALTTVSGVKTEIAEIINNSSVFPFGASASDSSNLKLAAIGKPLGVTISNGTAVISISLAAALPNNGFAPGQAIIKLTPTLSNYVIKWVCTSSGTALSSSKVPSTCTYS